MRILNGPFSEQWKQTHHEISNVPTPEYLLFRFYCVSYFHADNSGGSRISRRGGVNLMGGFQLLRWLCFKNFVCRNERIWILGGVHRARPLDPPMDNRSYTIVKPEPLLLLGRQSTGFSRYSLRMEVPSID